MAETFGEVLKSLREAAGMSLRGLAERVYYSKSEISFVETGARRCRPELVVACDNAFGTAPLLAVLADLDEGDPMRRRALITTLTAATGLAGLAGAAAVADLVRQGLLETAGQADDWDEVIADYSRRLVADPSPAYGAALLGQLMVARQRLADVGATPERMRAVALLGQLYGLWLGNQAKIASAHGWYRTAAVLADRSGDTESRVFVRARTASRAIFEGATVRETREKAEEALSLTARPSRGALEAHSAIVHVHALTGELTAGRMALGGMWDVLHRLKNASGADTARLLSFAHYLESRIGTPASADLAWANTEPVLRPVPVWWREGQVYFGLSLVRRGDVADGIAYALQAVQALPTRVHTVGMAVSDLLRVVPATHRSDELDELRGYRAAAPGPWVALGS
ncbi:helix-turn-helix transcriptional regulator [Micromonospora sp. NPDC005652]|uniref:helix-turn-helix transcriptional regulator n=1 Tax=Micromonospora sp. NPDC005652 TaxID=3157046 RepID=UPI0033F89960